MSITPDSEITLVHVDISKEHQLTFQNLTAQETYFNSLNGLSLTASSYQRKEGKVRFPAKIDDLTAYNYLFYNNTSYSTKTYYCYATKMEYINDGCTDVYIELDVFQTFQFDFVYKDSYIEREHVNDDTAGLHTVPENIETGEFIVDSSSDITSLRRMCYMVQVSTDISDVRIPGTNLGNTFVSGGFYICDTYADVLTLINQYETSTSIGPQAIENIYQVPINYIDIPGVDFSGQANFIYPFPVNSMTTPAVLTHSISKATTVDGYTPKNKKLLTSQYCYLMASNNNGGTCIYNYETFKSTACDFIIYAMPTCGGSAFLYPDDYGDNSGYSEFYPYTLQNGKYPINDWNFEMYSLWLRNNMSNIALANLTNQFQLGLGAVQGLLAIGGVPGGLTSSVSNIFSAFTRANQLVQAQQEKARTPITTVGQVSNGDIANALGINNFYFYKMSVKEEYARIIDDYFSMFGYKILRHKTPNITGRLNWNYVKTIEAIVEGNNIPHEYLLEYENMLNNGVTFWHNASTLKDYSQSNTIVT